jgi:hypothetical protein
VENYSKDPIERKCTGEIAYDECLRRERASARVTVAPPVQWSASNRLALWSVHTMREPAAVFYGRGERASGWAECSRGPEWASGNVVGERHAIVSPTETRGLVACGSRL